MPQEHVSNIDWNFIVETIREEKCILFIGPEIFIDEQNAPIEKQLIDYLDAPDNPSIHAVYEQDGLFLFTSSIKKTQIYYRIKKFYSQPSPGAEDLLNKLADLPFHFVISLTPDKRVFEAFQRKRANCQFGFYWKKQPGKNVIPEPGGTAPLVYNLLGSIDKQESMILTHNDLYDFFESIFQNNHMPEWIKMNIRNADNFIFLGLDFEKWYMQLLLRILNLHNDNFDFMRYAAYQKIADEIKTFCIDQFKIEFVSSKIPSFVEELVSHCKEMGVINDQNKEQVSLFSQFWDWLERDRIEEVLENLKLFLQQLGSEGKEVLDDLLLLSGRFRRLNRKKLEGIIDADRAEAESNQIRKSLLHILNKAQLLES